MMEATSLMSPLSIVFAWLMCIYIINDYNINYIHVISKIAMYIKLFLN